MKVKIMSEAGFKESLTGVSLSFGRQAETEQDFDALYQTALKLHGSDGGHNKFLESIVIWIDMTAPRYWWQQFDTYRVGMTKQSESTMHTIMKRPLTMSDFQSPIPHKILDLLNYNIQEKNFEIVKTILPESFLQRRIVCTNYKCLRNMILQRCTHKLSEWQYFINTVLNEIQHPELLPTK